ncbi:hypothetical protein TCAL_13240 [Tigriopus californicus]|uniref:G-protein coupled receptors family 2 profile 2 domain-containing protein n=1 Tax=Tigriopus californicus TaxID=6832 RepID=A0A553N7G1_TIGCA|nr:uncharacterized protein LOC131885792 [Tigriopus californicus]TRY61382.1 hypothetical protein TCAL_13240 [Tigriopus californicus]
MTLNVLAVLIGITLCQMSNAHKVIHLPKCCPRVDQILDNNQRCVQIPDHVSRRKHKLLGKLKDEVCRIHNEDPTQSDICSQRVELKWTTDDSSRSMDPKILRCPKRMQFEFNVIDVRAQDGKVFIQGPSGAIWVDLNDIPGSCIDMAILPLELVEGPILRVCSSLLNDDIATVSDLTGGSVTKCCPVGQVLDARDESCVPLPVHLKEMSHAWLPIRSVRHPSTGAMYARSSLKILAHPFRKVCPNSQVQMDEPVFILSNGKAVIRDRDASTFTHVNYTCADRYLIRTSSATRGVRQEGISALTTFRCTHPFSSSIEQGNMWSNDPNSKAIEHAPAASSSVLMEVCNEAHDLCIPKCCALDQVFHRTLSKCIPHPQNGSFAPKFHQDTYPHNTLDSIPHHYVLERQFYFLNNNECSENNFTNLEEKNISIKLLSNGMIHVDALEGAWRSQFCVDNFFDEVSNQVKFSGFKCIDSLSDYVASEDLTPPTGNLESAFRLVYIICGSFSALFLVITALIYVSLPHLRNLHGKLVLSNVISIFLTTLVLLFLFNVAPQSMQPGPHSPRHAEFLIFLSDRDCKLVGYAVYYLGICMFVWMTIMCVDACWTFAMAKIPKKRSEGFMFLIYSIIGWGSPMLLTSLLFAVDSGMFAIPFLRGSMPNMGTDSCFLSMQGVRYYFYIPVFLLLMVNGVMFVITYHSIRKSLKFSKQAGLKRISTAKGRGSHRVMTALRCDSNRSTTSPRTTISTTTTTTTTSATTTNKVADLSREEFSLFVKLFVIMGLSWALEIIHIELHGDHSAPDGYSKTVEVLFRIGGIFNVSRGIFIFLVFICKRSILVSLENRYPKLLTAFKWCCCCCCFRPQNGPSSNNSVTLMARTMIPLQDNTECLTSTGRPRTLGSFATPNDYDDESSLPLATPTFHDEAPSSFSSSTSSDLRLALEIESPGTNIQRHSSKGPKPLASIKRYSFFHSKTSDKKRNNNNNRKSVHIVDNHPKRRYSTTKNLKGSSFKASSLLLEA